jgi:hypothetical protein
MVQRNLAAGDLTLDLGNVCGGANGKWLLQITAIAGAGATLTPSITLDGINFVGVAMQPVAGGAVVLTATAAGAWYIDGSGGRIRLTLSGTTPTATVFATPSCEGGR